MKPKRQTLVPYAGAPKQPTGKKRLFPITRARLEAAARVFMKEGGYAYTGVSVISCAESRDPKIYNPRAAKAVEAARNILKAARDA